METYKNASLPTAERVRDLIARMNPLEKVAQLASVWVYEVLKSSTFDLPKAQGRLGQGIGQITRLGGAGLQRPEATARLHNTIQKFLVEETRLGIPALVHEEACSGFLTRGANVFPQALGVAASFDVSLPRRMGDAIREQMMALGARQALAPLLDVTRDPRWGRSEETYGEDRYLTSRMGAEFIKGLQSDHRKTGVVATGKHFVGYGNSEGGMNWAPAHIPPRELRETFLYPFEVAIREAGLQSIMPAYNELDGVPCHTNPELLTEVLRNQWGFTGTVVSDYFGINMVQDYHKTGTDKSRAAHLSLAAGVDVELPSMDCYGPELADALVRGEVAVELIDRSLERVLAQKFDLGLFDEPYVDVAAAAHHVQTPAHRALAQEAALKSLVLLKNDGVLPLSKALSRVAVVGPNADSLRNLLGDYTFPAHVESLLDMAADNFGNSPLPDDLNSIEAELPVMDSILQALRTQAPSVEFVYAQGCEVLGGTNEGIPAAFEAAAGADVVIAVVGDKSGLVDGCTSGETRDRARLELPGHQQALVKAMVATGKPVVLVLISGRPLALTWENEHVGAILEAWMPGEAGGEAVASVLFGQASPAGRVPLSFPRTVGQVPVYYAHRPSGGRSHWKGDYVEDSTQPLYPFGHGLSYTTIEYSRFTVPATAALGSDVEVSVTLTNTGTRGSDEVPQLYFTGTSLEVTRPVQELVGFTRVFLGPGDRKTVTFRLSTEQLGFVDRSMVYSVEPGDVVFRVGASSRDLRLTGRCQLTGSRWSPSRSRYATKVSIS